LVAFGISEAAAVGFAFADEDEKTQPVPADSQDWYPTKGPRG
jgi:hypothetical protein